MGVRDIELECGVVTIKDYGSNIEVFKDGDYFTHCFDGDIEFTTEENIEAFIEYEFEYHFQLTLSTNDRKKLTEKMKDYFYYHSKEVLGSRLGFLRGVKGITQKELSERSGVNLRMIQNYEQETKDISKASVTTVHALAVALGTTIEDLMDWE